MDFKDRLNALKPYVGGAVIGAIAITIVGFSADWVVTAGTLDQKVQSAKVTVLAEVCEKSAAQAWKRDGNKMAALEGWDNEEREQLAEKFAPVLADEAGKYDYRDEVVDRCDELLEPA